MRNRETGVRRRHETTCFTITFTPSYTILAVFASRTSNAITLGRFKWKIDIFACHIITRHKTTQMTLYQIPLHVSQFISTKTRKNRKMKSWVTQSAHFVFAILYLDIISSA